MTDRINTVKIWHRVDEMKVYYYHMLIALAVGDAEAKKNDSKSAPRGEEGVLMFRWLLPPDERTYVYTKRTTDDIFVEMLPPLEVNDGT